MKTAVTFPSLIRDPLRVEFPLAVSLSACSFFELRIPPRLRVYMIGGGTRSSVG